MYEKFVTTGTEHMVGSVDMLLSIIYLLKLSQLA